jgi:hypothetical protein
MELDDLKESWNARNSNYPPLQTADFQTMIKSIEKSKRGIRGVFFAELCIVLFIYLGFLLVVFWGGDVKPFMYKLVVISLMGAIPIGYRLYRAQQMMHTLDFSRDIKSNLIGFLVYYKTTLGLYRWGSYALLALLLLVFFTDSSFHELDIAFQYGTAGYILLAMLLIGPYIKKVYGSKVKSIESFLND